MKWFIITGRILFDDEDTVEIIHEESKELALACYQARLRAADPGNDNEIVINAVLVCDTEPRAI